MNDKNVSDRQIAADKRQMRWGEMPPSRRAGAILMGLIQFSLLIAALVDLRRRPPEQIRGSKRLWTFLVFINWIGPISYFLFGRRQPEAATDL